MATDEEIEASEETGSTRNRFWIWLKSISTPDGGYVIKAFLAIYLNVWLVLWGMLVFDIATLNFGFFEWAFKLGDTYEPPATLILMMLALAGGGLGGVIFGIDKLYKYSVKDEFKLVFAGDYIFRQFGAAALGTIVFALLSSGLLDLTLPSNKDSATPTPVATEAPASPEPVATEPPVAPVDVATLAPVATDPPIAPADIATLAPVATEPPVAPAGVATLEPAAMDPPVVPADVATLAPVATEPPVDSGGIATLEPAPEDSDGETILTEGKKDCEDTKEYPFDSESGFFAFGLGVLSGFGSYQVTKKLDQVIKVIFGQLTNEDIEK
jgi:hypothetical protein